MKKKKQTKNYNEIYGIIIVAITIIFLLSYQFIEKQTNLKQIEFNNCMKKTYTNEELDNNTLLLINDLDTYLNSLNYVSVKYQNIYTSFTYSHNETDSFYGASLVKLVMGLYLIDNNIDLNSTIKYTGKIRKEGSKMMEQRTIGEYISVKDLLNYSITNSDNTAYSILVNEYGFNNIRTYAKSLGATKMLKGGIFPNQSANDMNLFLLKAYELINTSSNGHLLKEYMINNIDNYLDYNNSLNVGHKYGYYGKMFHDVGIVFSNNPYTLSVLTTYGNKNYSNIINTISKMISSINDSFYNNRIRICNSINM